MAWYYDPEKNEVLEAITPPKDYAPFENKASALRWAWMHLKSGLDLYKEKEREIRAALVDCLLPEKVEGTHHFDNITITCAYDYKVTDPQLIPQELASRVLRWKPELSKTEFKKCNEAEQIIISQAVTCKWGAPQIKIKL